jgi:branched-chain amino acid transport system permease protein
MWFVLPIAVLVAATFGVLLGAPTLKLRGDYLAIVTLGFGEIIRIFMNNLDRPVNITNGPKGITAVDPVHIFGFDFSKSHEIFGLKFTPVFMYYYLLVALVIVIVFICLRLQNSRIGRAWVAIREDEIAAKAMGINTRNIKLLAFHGRLVRRRVGRGVRRVPGLRLAGIVHAVGIDLRAGHRGAGRHGPHPGRDPGRHPAGGLPGTAARRGGAAADRLFGQVIVDAEVLRQLLFGLAWWA